MCKNIFMACNPLSGSLCRQMLLGQACTLRLNLESSSYNIIM